MSINPYQSPTALDSRSGEEPAAVRRDGVHEYLLSANNADGKKVTERVEASNADAAVKTFEARGYTEIVLHTDDFGALFTNQSKCEPVVTPKDFVRRCPRLARGSFTLAVYIVGVPRASDFGPLGRRRRPSGPKSGRGSRAMPDVDN